MILSRVLLMMLLVIGGVWGQPPVKRQSSLSSPLAMGMRILGNIRSGMTRTIQGIFGGGNPQSSKEVGQNRPPRLHLPPPEPAPVAQVHDIGFGAGSGDNTVSHTGTGFGSNTFSHTGTGTEAPSSFFTVLHESDASTAFPDTRGFTDESFSPSDFFTGNNPFQGNVEEETLSLHQEVLGPQLAREPQHIPPVVHENINPTFHAGGFPSQSPPRTSFGLEDAQKESPIPSGNSNVFNRGIRLSPTPFSGTQAPLPGQLLDFPKPHSILSSRADGSKIKSHLTPKFEAPLIPVIPNTPSFRFTPSNSPTPSVQKAVLVAKSDLTPPAATVSVFVGQKPKHPTPAALPTASRLRSTQKATLFPEFKEVKQQKDFAGKQSIQATPGGLINTGIKMRLAPSSKDREGDDVEVSSYEFGYGVLDRNSGNQFFHAEKREEGLTKGSYKIQLPDGRVQTVTYQADKQGFRPKISYEGKATYPASKDEKLVGQ